MVSTISTRRRTHSKAQKRLRGKTLSRVAEPLDLHDEVVESEPEQRALLPREEPETVLENDFENQENLLIEEPTPSEEEQRFLTAEEEREIIRRVQQGDRAAFEQLVAAYEQKAYYTALQFVNNPEDAKDLSQDCFVKAYKAIKTFDINSPFFPWFYKIIKNHCLNFLKKNQRVRSDYMSQMEEDNHQQFEDSRQPTPSDWFVNDDVRHKLWQAIERLKPDFREIIVMKHFHNLSYKEIAVALQIPIGTVMSRLFNARQELREKYEEVLKGK